MHCVHSVTTLRVECACYVISMCRCPIQDYSASALRGGLGVTGLRVVCHAFRQKPHGPHSLLPAPSLSLSHSSELTQQDRMLRLFSLAAM